MTHVRALSRDGFVAACAVLVSSALAFVACGGSEGPPAQSPQQKDVRLTGVSANDQSRCDYKGRADREASEVSPHEGQAWSLVQRTIGEVLGDAIVAPFLSVGGTDCRHYKPVTDALYRFAPFVYGPDDLKLPHGIDERIAVASLPSAVRFYARLIENASAN